MACLIVLTLALALKVGTCLLALLRLGILGQGLSHIVCLGALASKVIKVMYYWILSSPGFNILTKESYIRAFNQNRLMVPSDTPSIQCQWAYS